MANLKKIKFYVLCAFIIFSSTIILSGCGKQYNITISKIAPVGYTVSTSDDNEKVEDGSSYEIYVNAEDGYALDGIIIKVNGNIVQGIVQANAEDQLTNISDENGAQYYRTLSYKINKVSSDININIDFSNSGLIERTITILDLENQNALYATNISSDNTLKTEFDSSVISTLEEIENNAISVKYDDNIYIFLDEDIELSILSSDDFRLYRSLKKYGNTPYKYNGKYVYYLRNIKDNFSIAKRVEEFENNLYTTETTANIAFMKSDSEFVDINYHGGSINNDAIGSLNGWGDFWHSYLYLGDKETFNDEQIENNLIQDYLDIMGKKAYYRLSLNPDLYDSNTQIENIASFYLVENIYQSTTNLTPLTINRDSISAYLEVNKSDLEQFIEDEKAGVYLKAVIKEEVLTEDYVGFKLNYLNGDLNTGIKIEVDELNHFLNYSEFNQNNETIYYFHKSYLYNDTIQNNLIMSFGNQNYYNDMPYMISTKIEISKLNDLNIIASYETNYPGNEVYADNISLQNHGIELQEDVKNLFIIT
ncbi:MAG: hypothetical protein PHC46_00555, partial [Clostridia bacterium]|nr:hypothetical protein [Clostridia bacterium]